MKKINLQFFLIISLLNVCIINKILAQTNSERLTNIAAAIPAIDKLFERYAEQNHFPGLVYGLIVDGQLIHTGNWGFSNIAEKHPADSNSVFRIASMTKSFTSMAILKLRDEGRLKLDDPVSLYIPEMQGQKFLTADAPAITIRHLLMHAAGFPEDNPWGDRQLAISDEAFIQIIKSGLTFSNDPGLTFEYSNMGFAMLGYIIKKVSGQSYQTYITENILNPLGMTHTYWEYTKVPTKDLAHGYRWLNEQWVEQPMLHDGVYGAMGGLITSIEDFSKYAAVHLTAWPPSNGEEKGPVKRSSLREMQFPWNIIALDQQFINANGRTCPIVFAYGYGLVWSKDCDRRVLIDHSGGLPGFGSNWTIMPDYGLGVISFSNLTYAPTSDINRQVLDTLIALSKTQPRKLPASAILNQRKNELIQLLPEWRNSDATHIFAENFFMDYFPDSLRKEAINIFSEVGNVIHIQELVPENNLRGLFIMEGEYGDIEIGFTLTPENPPLIQQYYIKKRKKGN